MSTTIDEKVVEMRFDNRDFERNTKQSISTLEKLKQSLKFKGSAKDLENVNNAAKKISFSGLSSGIETVKCKFSALEVVGVTCLSRITNSAITAGERIIKSLSVDQIGSGFKEYELKMGSVQTIIASTGEDLQTVNRYLEELNTYSDKTIYSFSDMTNNIGKFTNAGVKLKDAVAAIQGISNEAAVSGANAEEASRAMYNFAQALSAGYVKLIDWKSIENANMATVEFKNELIKTALELGTIKKEGDKYVTTTTNMQGKVSSAFDATQNFNDSLAHQWMTTDVLTKTLGRYADETTKIGKKAFAAAQDVKTFSMMMDTLREAVGSGWAQTWELIVGDFEEAKALFTKASNFFGGIIEKTSKARNDLLKGALGEASLNLSDWKSIQNAGYATEEFQNALIKTAKQHGISIKKMIKDEGSFEDTLKNGWLTSDIMKETLESTGVATDKASKKLGSSLNDLKEIAKEVVQGNWGDGSERKKALTEAGKDYEAVQKVVNHMLLGTELDLEKVTKKELKSIGLTEEQSKRFLDMAESAKKAGTPINELMKKLERPTGRELIIDSLANIGSSLVRVFQAIGKAYREIFPPLTSDKLYDTIKAFHDFTEGLLESTEDTENLRRTFKGLFAVIDIIRMMIGGGLKLAFEIFKAVLEALDLDILDATASVGDAIVAFRDWLKTDNFLIQGIKTLGKWIASVITGIVEFVKALQQIEGVQVAIDKVCEFFIDLYETVTGFFKKSSEDADGFISKVNEINLTTPNGIISFCTKAKQAMSDFISNMGEKIDNFGEWFTSLPNKAKDGFDKVIESTGTFGEKLVAIFEFIKEKLANIDWGAVIAGGAGIGLFVMIRKITRFVDILSKPIEIFNTLMNSVAGVCKGLKFDLYTKGLMNLAKSIFILAGSMLILSRLSGEQLAMSVAAIGAIGAALIGFMAIFTKMGVAGDKNAANVATTSAAIISMAISVKILIKCISTLNDMDPKSALRSVMIIMSLLTQLGVMSVLVGSAGGNLAKGGMTILAFAIGIRILINALKKLDGLKLEHGLRSMIILGTMIKMIQSICKSAGGIQSMGAAGVIVGVAIGIRILLKAFKILDGMDTGTILKSLISISVIMGMFAVILKSANKIGPDSKEAGKMILLMSASLLLISLAIRGIAKIGTADLVKATTVITALLGVFGALVYVSRYAGRNSAKAGTMLLSMTASLLVMTLVMSILSRFDDKGLAKATAAMTVLCGCISGIIAVTKLAEKVKISTLIMLMTTITVLSSVLIILSQLDQNGVETAGIALTSVLTAFASIVAATKLIGKMDKSAIGTIGILMAVVVALGGIVIALASLEVGSAIGAALSISVLLEAMSAAIVILGLANSPSKGAMASLAVMTGIIAILGVIVYNLEGMDVQSAIGSALALGVLINAMSTAIAILSLSKGNISAKTIGIMALLGGIIAELALVLYAVKAMDINPSMENVLALSTLLAALSGVTVILSYFKAGGGAAAAEGVAVLSVLIAAIGVVMMALGELNYLISTDGADFLNEGVEVLAAIGKGIGEFIGNLVGGIADGVMSTLPNLGTYLSEFIQNAGGFIKGIESIDPKAADAAISLAKAIMMLTAAELLEGIASFIGGSMDMGEFKSKMSGLGEAVVAFNDAVSGKIDNTNSVEVAASAGAMLAELNNSLPRTGGKLQEWLGEKDLGSFGEKIKVFGEAIVEFSKTVKGIENTNSIEAAAAAGTLLAELNDKLPRNDGILQEFIGDKDFSEWGPKLIDFARCLGGFCKQLETNPIKGKAVEAAAAAGSLMADLNSKLPANDGILQEWFTGDKDLKTFGEKLQLFGESLVSFSNEVKSLDSNSVEKASIASEMMVELANKLPDTEGVLGFFTGSKTTLDDFGEDLVSFGESIASFSEKVRGKIDAKSAEDAKNAGETMAGLYKTLSESNISDGKVFGMFGDSNLVDFGEDLEDFGEAISSYSESVKNIDTSKISEIPGIVESLIKVSDAMSSNNLEDLADGFGDLAEADLAVFCEKFYLAKPVIEDTFSKFMTTCVEVFNKKKVSFELVGKSLLDALIRGLDSKRDGFKDAGVNAVQGFIDGMRSKIQNGDVEKVGTELGKAALRAAKKALDEHSPSKEMYKVGDFAIQGFVNALKDGKKSITQTTTSLMKGFVAQVGKATNVNKYAAGSILHYTNIYASCFKKKKEATQFAEKALGSYIKKLYKESTAYKQDLSTLKGHTKALKEQYKKRAELEKTLSKTKKKSDKDNIKKQIKSVNKEIEKAKKQIIKDGNEIEKHAKENFLNIKKSIKDTVKSSMDLFSVSMDTGRGLFDPIEESAESAKTKTDELKDSISDMLKSYVDISNISKDTGISLFDEFNTNGKAKEKSDAIAAAEENLTEATENLEEANNNLAKAEQNLLEAQTRSNEVHGRSLKFLEDIKNAEEEVANAKKAVEEAEKAKAEAEEASQNAQNDTVIGEILNNMESQINGIEDLEKAYKQLSEKGLEKGLIAKLKELGVSGADQVKAFVEASQEEIDKANDLFNKSQKMSADKFLENFKTKIDDITNWRKGVIKIQSLDLDQSVKDSLMAKIQSEGINSIDYIETILSMSKEQLAEFNAYYLEALATPVKAAKKVAKEATDDAKDSQEESELTMKDILKTMNANNKSVSEYQKDINKLKATGLCDGMIEELKKLGIDGHDQIKVFLTASAEEIKKANKLFKENGKLTSQSLIDGFKDKIGDAKAWGNNVTELEKKMKKAGVSSEIRAAILQEVSDKGVEGNEFLEAILGMDKDSFAKFIKQYDQYLKVPNTVANKVLAAQADAEIKTRKEKQKEALDFAAEVLDAIGDTLTKGTSKNAKSSITALVDTLLASKPKAKSTAGEVGDAVNSAIKRYINKTTGKQISGNLIAGLTNGLTDNLSSVVSAGNIVAKSILNNVKKTLGIHSPSKEFEAIGRYSDEGLANGLKKYTLTVTDAAENVGKNAVETLSKSISKITDLADIDMDSVPTIRPVLDLTDVNEGAKQIDSMLSNKNVGVYSSDLASKINTSMNKSADRQNGLTSGNVNNNSEVTLNNTFNITGSDPKAVASEVDRIIQRQIYRKDAQWA